MRTVFILVPGAPVGKGRHRTRCYLAGGKIIQQNYTPEPTQIYEAAARYEAERSMQGIALFDGPVAVTMEVFAPIPVSYSKAKTKRCLEGLVLPTKKPDLDNIQKAIFDAFNGSVWIDDCQVVRVTASKRYAETPCVAVTVTTLEPKCW